MSTFPIWPQPPSLTRSAPPSAVPITHVGKFAVAPAPRTAVTSAPPRSYLEQLRQVSSAQVAPYVELLRSEAERSPAALRAEDRPLREALIALLAHTLATGREMISGKEIFWRLRVPPQREKQQGRHIARVLRSLGWVRCRYGKNEPGKRVWGWRYREWNVSASVELPFEAAPEGGPLPVSARRAPIIPIYGDDVPLSETTPEGVWRLIRPPIGPRLKIGM